jgi:hypothetical protein
MELCIEGVGMGQLGNLLSLKVIFEPASF